MTITAEAVQQYLDSQKEATERAARTPEERTEEEQQAHWAKLNAEALERQGIEKHGKEGWKREKAKRLEQERKHEAQLESLRAKKEAKMEAEAKRIYVSEGGSVDGFKDAWPKIKRQLLLDRTTARMSPTVRRTRLECRLGGKQ